jgi:hypothetical protein
VTGVAVAAGLLGLLAAGCAAIPSSGYPQSTPTPAPVGGGGGAPDCCRMILRGPQQNWSAAQIVRGFLLASASIAHDHALARQYLTKDANKAWQPRKGVTILAPAPQARQLPGRVTSPGGKLTVLVTGQKVATLTSTGQYEPTPPNDSRANFTLVPVNGQLRIDGLPLGTAQHPTHQLLLASDLFHLVYTPRNLYYYGMRDQSLVPDPVFVAAEDPDPGSELIDDLREDPSGELQNAASTAFPPGMQRPRLQVLPGPSGGKIAIVDLKLPSQVKAKQEQQVAAQVATQIVATLTSSAYSPPLFQAVKLRINGRFWAPLSHDPLLNLSSISGSVPHPRSNSELYYLTSGGAPRMLGSRSVHGVAVQAGQTTFDTVAVAPGGGYFAGTGAPDSTLYTASLPPVTDAKTSGHAAPLHLHSQFTATSITSMSWDSVNDLWVTGRRGDTNGVWVLPGGKAPAIRVHLPRGVDRVVSLRVAPDGVRVAMILGSGSSGRLVLGAVVHDAPGFYILPTVPLDAGLAKATSLSWYDEDHLLVVTAPQAMTGAQTGLWDVPANGDSARQLNGQSGMVGVTAAGPENPVYLSLSTGKVERAVTLGEPWFGVTAGRAATYPG